MVSKPTLCVPPDSVKVPVPAPPTRVTSVANSTTGEPSREKLALPAPFARANVVTWIVPPPTFSVPPS